MAYGDLYERFLQIEAELGLFDVEVDGVPVWERMRLPVFRTILQRKGLWGPEGAELGKTPRNVLKGASLFAKNLVTRNPLLAESRDALFWGYERRKRLGDGQYWDLFCDPLYEDLELDYLHVETPHRIGHLTPAKTPRLRYLDLLEYGGTALRATGLVDVDVPAATAAELRAVRRELASEFDVDIDVLDRAEFRLAVRRSSLSLYRRLLGRVDPEIVFVVVSFQKETFVEACKAFGVPVVELQHGMLSRYEYGYPGDRTKATFPDYFLSWGDYWNDRVDFPIPDADVRTVGYRHFERQRDRLQDEGEGEGVVFLSQGNVGEALSKAAVELSEHPSIDPADVVYKLHPREYGRWRSDYPWLRSADLTVVGEDGPDLYEVFARCTAQVGVYSTAIFEGLGFGLATYLYDLPGVEEMADLQADGHAELVASPDELSGALTKRRPPSVDAGTFFAPNATDRFVTVVRDVCEECDVDFHLERPS